MHPEVLRAIASAQARDMRLAAKQSERARQARRGAQRASVREARRGPFRRAVRRAGPAPAWRLVTGGAAAAREPADGCGHAGHRAA